MFHRVCVSVDWQCRHSNKQSDGEAESCDWSVEEQTSSWGLWTPR